MDIRGSLFLFFVFLLVSFSATAEIDITIIQTSDLHSHFLPNDSEYRLGGLARVKSKIDELRRAHPNSLVLDAGDFSEGNIFYTLDSGETTFRLLSAFNYDAMVLGNHDWLVGPDAMVKTLKLATPALPIISANLNMDALGEEHELRNLIKPYVIKNIAGVKVGILGLSTFQLIYDTYFQPVKVRNPVTPARYYVDYLKNKENCDIVIALTHLGLTPDKIVAQTVPGLDLIVGGHNHRLFNEPVYSNGVPIVHIGRWGEYVGETTLTFDQGKTRLKDFKTHQIDDSVVSDVTIQGLVDGSLKRAESLLYGAYDGKSVDLPVDLPMDKMRESVFANQVVDAIRDAARTEIAFDSPTLSARGLHRGLNSPLDFYNSNPHIAKFTEGFLSWRIFSFDVSGVVLKLLMGGLYRFGGAVSISNGHVVVSQRAKVNPLVNVEVNGEPLENFRTYRIAGSQGVFAVFDFLKQKGIPINIANTNDSGIEVWSALNQYLYKNRDHLKDILKWEGRTRTQEPDLMVRPEEIQIDSRDPGQINLRFAVRNNGLESSEPSEVTLGWLPLGSHIANRLNDSHWDGYTDVTTISVPALSGGDVYMASYILKPQDALQGRFPFRFIVRPTLTEVDVTNNLLATTVEVQ